MKNFHIRNQLSVIRDRNNPKSFNEATMPIIIVFEDGHIVQTISIRGAVSIIAGYDYFDIKDAKSEWNYRLDAAVKQSKAALEKGILTVIYDPIEDLISDGLTIHPGTHNSDLSSDENIRAENIYIHNDRLFLLSLIKIKAINIYEREDSFQLKHHPTWDKLKSGEISQNCSWCIHAIKEPINASSEYFCPIYYLNICSNDGSNCCSFAFSPNEGAHDLIYPGGMYHDIGLNYDIDKLFETLGQRYICPNIIL